jgi:hypothetical protein
MVSSGYTRRSTLNAANAPACEWEIRLEDLIAVGRCTNRMSVWVLDINQAPPSLESCS